MTTLEWDKVGERFFETGIDRGVLYPWGSYAVPWNGLTSLEEQFSRETKSYYLDGIKYLQQQITGDFAAKLKAYTYPDQFEECLGIANTGYGVYVHDQKAKAFDLSYRTRLGNDLEGTDLGYRIHLLYNLLASPDSVGFSTIDSAIKPVEFSWSITSTPNWLTGYKPTAHISLNSTDIPSEILAELEAIIYGSDEEDPRLPTFDELVTLLESTAITIVDHGDGTWSAIGPADNVSSDGEMFTLTDIDATYPDDDRYRIKSTLLTD